MMDILGFAEMAKQAQRAGEVARATLRPSPQQKPEHKPMCHEKRGHHYGRYKECSAERAGTDVDADLALVDGVQQIKRRPTD
jgi:hypothetical protein